MNCHIYTMDCLEGMKDMKGDTVDVVVTSPPYNIGVNYNSYADNLSESEYLDWVGDVAKGLHRVLKDEGSLFLNIGTKPSNPLWPIEVAKVVSKTFRLQNTIHWIKSIAIPIGDVGDYPHMIRSISVGHFKPVNSANYLNNCHEYIFHFTKTGKVGLDKLAIGVEYQDKSNVRRWKTGRDLRDRGNTWFIPYKTVTTSKPHPSTFPVKLPEYCIRVHGLHKTKLVLDPFMGIGTTAVACQKLGVDCIGFELDEEYCQIALNRITGESGQGEEGTTSRASTENYKLVIQNLDPIAMKPLMEKVIGQGNCQSLIKKLQHQYSPKENLIVLGSADVKKILSCTSLYPGNPFRDILAPIVQAIQDIRNDWGNDL